MELHSEETVQCRGALALPAALCTQERPLDLICQAAEVLAQPPIRLVLETTERQIPGGSPCTPLFMQGSGSQPYHKNNGHHILFLI